MRKRGFTLVELMIALAITSLVLAALAAVTFAVSVNWRAAGEAESSYVTGAQVQARLSQWFRGAPMLGAYHQGSLANSGTDAAIFFWKGDETSVANPSGDGQMQFNEIGLLEYDCGTEELHLYEVSDWSSWSTVAKNAANALAGTDFISDASNMAEFRQACPARRVVMRNVTGVVLNTVSTSDRPLVEYLMKVRDSADAVGTHYGTITLRAPVSASN